MSGIVIVPLKEQGLEAFLKENNLTLRVEEISPNRWRAEIPGARYKPDPTNPTSSFYASSAKFDNICEYNGFDIDNPGTSEDAIVGLGKKISGRELQLVNDTIIKVPKLNYNPILSRSNVV